MIIFFLLILCKGLNAEIRIYASSFFDMTSQLGGGAVYSDDGDITYSFVHCNFINCTSNGDYGGAIQLNVLQCNMYKICGFNCRVNKVRSQGQFCYIVNRGNCSNDINHSTIVSCGIDNSGIQALFLTNNGGRNKGSHYINEFNVTRCQNSKISMMFYSSILLIENAPLRLSFATFNRNVGNSLFSFFTSFDSTMDYLNIVNNTARFGFNYGIGSMLINRCCYKENHDGSGLHYLLAIYLIRINTTMKFENSFIDFDLSKDSYIEKRNVVVTKNIKTHNIQIIDNKCTFVYPSTINSQNAKIESRSFSKSHTFTPSRINVLNRAIVQRQNDKISVASSAGIVLSISVFVIIGSVLMMILYLRVKTKENEENSFEYTSDIVDSSSDYSYSYWYSYSASYETNIYSEINYYRSSLIGYNQ